MLTRNEHVVELTGDDAIAHVAGAAMGDGASAPFHHDDTVFITHDAERCESRQVFKKVLRNGAAGVFQGKILVKPDAQKTDGYQISQALLLDDDSSFQAKPELEIYADDVQCSHGSTTGAIDETRSITCAPAGCRRRRRRTSWCWPSWPRRSTRSRMRAFRTTSARGWSNGCRGGVAAETMSVSRDIVATWRRPRTVMRSLLAQGRREDRALMFLILACGIIFVSQWPVISREAALDAQGAPLQARLAITFFAWLMIWPLAFYGLGSLTHLIAAALGRTGQLLHRAASALLDASGLRAGMAVLRAGAGIHWAGAGPNACRDRPGLGLRHDLGHLSARSRVQPGGGGRA
jgi:hypothetical protein